MKAPKHLTLINTVVFVRHRGESRRIFKEVLIVSLDLIWKDRGHVFVNLYLVPSMMPAL